MAVLKRMSTDGLAALAAELPEDAPDENNDATDFIHAMKFETGRKRIEFSVIYAMYKIWSD